MGQDLGQLDDAVISTATGSELTLTIQPTRQQTWQVAQVAVECQAAPSGSTCVMRKNGRVVTPLVPNLDAAGGDPPITLRPADLLTITWTGLVGGEVAQANYFYTLVDP